MSFNRIAELRKEKGLTLEALAEATDQHFTTVARHQSGHIERIPLDKLVSYSKVLECQILDLFMDPKEMPGGNGAQGTE